MCCSIDFPAKYQSWQTTDPVTLFDAPTLKAEANPKVRTAALVQAGTAASRCCIEACSLAFRRLCLTGWSSHGLHSLLEWAVLGTTACCNARAWTDLQNCRCIALHG